MFLRERPEEATEVAMKRLRFRNITKPMLTDAIKSYVRAFPQGVPGMPSPEGVKSILEYEVRLPMKMEETLTAEKFPGSAMGRRGEEGKVATEGEQIDCAKGGSN
jgi:hypothetical protein